MSNFSRNIFTDHKAKIHRNQCHQAEEAVLRAAMPGLGVAQALGMARIRQKSDKCGKCPIAYAIEIAHKLAFAYEFML